MNWELYGKCAICKHKRFFIRKREVTLPTGHKALSKKLMCDSCYRGLRAVLKSKP